MMANNLRKVLAVVLATTMCAGTMSLPVFAEDGTVVEEGTITNKDSTVTEHITTTTTTTDPETGKVIVTVTIDKQTDGTNDRGEIIDRDETRVETSVIDNEGNLEQFKWRENGSEIKEWVEEDDGNQKGQPDITIELKPGETSSASSDQTSDTFGDVQNGENDLEYDYTVITKTDREAEAKMDEGEIKTEITGTSDLKPLQSDKSMVDDPTQQLLKTWSYQLTFNAAEQTEAPEGYDYLYLGFGQVSDFDAGVITPSGEKHQSCALQFQLAYAPDFVPGDTIDYDKMELFTAYCVDLTTEAVGNYWYRVDDLEDAGYYDKEAAANIRSVALNGYWGVKDDETTEEAELGSLERLKANMKAALEAGEITGITAEEIDSITAGQALNATQSAIWSYSNATTSGAVVDTDRLAVTGYNGDTPSEADLKNVNAIYAYLMGLEPTEKSESTQIIDRDSYIKEGSMSITIGDKTDDARNYDDDDDNDIYNVSLNFALVVTPNNDKDDLIVQVISGVDENGNQIVVAQGRIAGGDSAEDEANGFSNVIYDESTGTYTLENLTLSENSDFSFDLQLVGTQYLEEGVYIFTSEQRDGTDANQNGEIDEDEKNSSQTFVSLLKGSKEVNVTQSFVISFNVDEDNKMRAEHYWHSEGDLTYDNEEDDEEYNKEEITTPETSEKETPVINVSMVTVIPTETESEELTTDDVISAKNEEIFEELETVEISEGDVPLVTIPDEDIPLADVPQTGDTSFVWYAVSLVAGIGLAGLNVFGKKGKKEHNN